MRPMRQPATFTRRAGGLAALPAVALLGGCYTVDTTIDAPDANPGDGVCARALTAAEIRQGWDLRLPARGDAQARALQHLERLPSVARAQVERLAGAAQSGASPSTIERQPMTPAVREALLAARQAAGAPRLPGAAPLDDLVDQPPRLCTLRAAIMEANAHALKSYISVPPGLYALTLPHAPDGAGGRLLVRGSMRIQGQGAGETIVDGQDRSTVFHVDGQRANTEVEINHLRVQHGDAQAGGGLRLSRGRIELEEIDVRDNRAFTGGAGLYVGREATVYLRRSTMVGNVAQGLAGGAVWNDGRLWVYDSTLSGNQSNRAGAIHNQADGQLNLRNVTITGNRADVDDFSGASGTGGIHQGAFAVLNNVTVTLNEGTPDRAGGLYMVRGATTVVRNSIIAGNIAPGGPADCAGTLSADSRYNLIGDSSGCVIPAHVATFVLDQPAQLGPLSAANGGPTPTHQPLSGSPALDVAYAFPPPAAPACEPRDQRGVPRPQGLQGTPRCDMGAVEVTGTGAQVTGFMLVDAATDTDLRPLRHDDWLRAGELPAQWTIRATTAGAVGSVVFGLDGDPAWRTENSAPYAAGGDAGGDYAPLALPAGERTLTATPFSAAGGAGAAGPSRTIRFLIIGS